MAYNTVAEIPGTDLKDELVMLGGHMDSWHSGTGATDNGAGVSVAMEAVRILQALNLKPRRTIRIALWSGEEEGLLGSRAFVKEHFGKSPPNMFGPPPSGGNSPAAASRNRNGSGASTKDFADSAPKPEFDKFSAYFNLDNGTGKIRGVYMQGNEAVRPIFRKWLQPFREMGASTLTISNTGGTDHQSFDGIGLPGFQFIQDEIEYGTRTHHSNQDVFDRIQADDMKQASVIMAAFVYNAAMADQKLPRKPAATPSSETPAPCPCGRPRPASCRRDGRPYKGRHTPAALPFPLLPRGAGGWPGTGMSRVPGGSKQSPLAEFPDRPAPKPLAGGARCNPQEKCPGHSLSSLSSIAIAWLKTSNHGGPGGGLARARASATAYRSLLALTFSTAARK